MNNIWIKVITKDYYKLLLRINALDIEVLDNKKEKDYILLKINYKDYDKIKKHLISYKVCLYKEEGLLKIKSIFKKYIVFIISFLLGIILLIMMNSIIIKISINTLNEELSIILRKELSHYGIKNLSIKKNYKDLEIIKDKILDKYKDKITWIEIKYDGLIMNVELIEKENIYKDNNYKNCDIISRKDAKIIGINLYRGILQKEVGDYITKGSVIVSGTITHNDEIKNVTCANALVYGEVWYLVKIKMPLKEEVKEYTGKTRYNINTLINNKYHKIFRSRINTFEEDYINIYKLKGFEINLVKEKEIKYSYKLLSEKEAYLKSLDKARESINLELKDKGEIIDQKVLKKEVNDSTIYLEVFIITKEVINELNVIEEGE